MDNLLILYLIPRAKVWKRYRSQSANKHGGPGPSWGHLGLQISTTHRRRSSFSVETSWRKLKPVKTLVSPSPLDHDDLHVWEPSDLNFKNIYLMKYINLLYYNPPDSPVSRSVCICARFPSWLQTATVVINIAAVFHSCWPKCSHIHTAPSLSWNTTDLSATALLHILGFMCFLIL